MSASDAAALSSASSMLDELVARVTEVAGRYANTDREDVVHQLHEVERALRIAGRALDNAVRTISR
jgi:phenylpyruvate tautomerase PptA (4-oxalocrotonate tautomerase family)